MADETDDPASVAYYAMAKSDAEKMASYVARGRNLEDIPKQDLDDRYVAAFRFWVGEPHDARRQIMHDDLTAEYDLRKVEPPFDRVKPEMDALQDLARKAIADMTLEQRQRMNDKLHEDYDELAKRRN